MDFEYNGVIYRISVEKIKEEINVLLDRVKEAIAEAIRLMDKSFKEILEYIEYEPKKAKRELPFCGYVTDRYSRIKSQRVIPISYNVQHIRRNM